MRLLNIETSPRGSRSASIAVTSAFLEAYRARTAPLPFGDLDRRAAAHASACTLARIDGKSPVDYLDAPRRHAARRFALAALLDPPTSCSGLLTLLAREMQL